MIAIKVIIKRILRVNKGNVKQEKGNPFLAISKVILLYLFWIN